MHVVSTWLIEKRAPAQLEKELFSIRDKAAKAGYPVMGMRRHGEVEGDYLVELFGEPQVEEGGIELFWKEASDS